jgi:hypothetical protein
MEQTCLNLVSLLPSSSCSRTHVRTIYHREYTPWWTIGNISSTISQLDRQDSSSKLSSSLLFCVVSIWVQEGEWEVEGDQGSQRQSCCWVDAAADSKYTQTYGLYGQWTVVVSLVPLVESQIRSHMFRIDKWHRRWSSAWC